MSSVAPKVSVIMSAYNASEYVFDAVDSVLTQTMGDFEFIIFEDGSSDDTRSILQSFDDHRIRLVLRKTNIGLTANLAEGVRLARGEYIARMDADDVCMPHRFEMQVGCMAVDPALGLLGSAVTFFDGSGWEFVATQPGSHDEIACELLLGYTLLHPTVMIRSEVLKRHELNYDTSYRVSQDHDLWTRMAKVTRMANLPAALVRMRNHGGKISRMDNGSQKAFSDQVRQRELRQLGIELSEGAAASFNDACALRPLHAWEDVVRLDCVLKKILAANRVKGVYNQDVLRKRVHAKLFEVCRNELIAGNLAGAAYWRCGAFWHYRSDRTIRDIAGMLFRTITLPRFARRVA